MSDPRIVVKYHHRRALGTVDLNALFETLFDAYGDGVAVEFVAMDEREKAESSESTDVGITLVRERFRILETRGPTDVRRRRDLELAAVAVGRK